MKNAYKHTHMDTIQPNTISCTILIGTWAFCMQSGESKFVPCCSSNVKNGKIFSILLLELFELVSFGLVDAFFRVLFPFHFFFCGVFFVCVCSLNFCNVVCRTPNRLQFIAIAFVGFRWKSEWANGQVNEAGDRSLKLHTYTILSTQIHNCTNLYRCVFRFGPYFSSW